ncbi:MAG: lysophospholipid acyltransferase family protein [Kiritimatiellae bacterium]|nr:lysophospholipid acyltransferase family protein [Kiritimatiellia bacterium]
MSSDTPKIKAKYKAEYRAVKFLGALFCFLPYSVCLVIAAGLAKLASLIMHKRVNEAVRRIKLVMGDAVTTCQAKRMAWISLRNTAFNLVEMLRIKKTNLDFIKKIMPNIEESIGQIKKVMDDANNGKGVILALPHMGNWDLTGSAVFLSGMPIFSVAGKQHNPLMNKLINDMRSGHGMAILERRTNTAAQIRTRINAGEIFAILPDTRSFTPDILTPFLGGEANLARGMAVFARASEVPIIPTIIHRVGWKRFQIKLYPPIYPNMELDKQEDIVRLTHEVIAIIDQEIHSHPEQWFWYNKRWVLDPVGK